VTTFASRKTDASMRILAASIVLSLFLAASAFGQAWTQSAGAAFVKASVGLASTSERYDHRGQVVPYDPRITPEAGNAFVDRSVYLYAEYGAVEGITVVGMLPLKSITVLEPADAGLIERQSTDLGSASLGLRIALQDVIGLPKQWALAANLGVSLPLGYRRDVAPAVGPGQVDAEVLVSVGRSLWPLPAYVQAGAGLRFRSGIYGLSRRVACGPSPPAGRECSVSSPEIEYSDELLARLEAGYTIGGRVLLQGLSDVVWSVRTPHPVEAAGTIIQPEGFPQQRFVRIGGGASVHLFGDTQLTVQGFAAPYARNALRAVEVFIGLQTHW